MTRAYIISVLLLCVFGYAIAQDAPPDNRYCGMGNEPQFGASDGPAALPQSCFYTAIKATPSPGRVVLVPAGSDLQSYVSKAHCGETLELASGATYNGAFNFPAKGCDDKHWITVRSAGALPAEGIRISPCNAGGANKVILDRVWVHGTERDETQRGIAIPGASYIAVIDSYFSDFHCIAKTGSCEDAQTVWGGAGEVAGGTYKIVNNYLEAAGEGILFGGGAGSTTPSDIEIRRNHFYKPSIWHNSDANYIGVPFIVKNNFELKNGIR